MDEWIPPGHGEHTAEEETRWIPVCPICGAMLRRDLDGDPLDWRCDVHEQVVPDWLYDKEG